MNRAAVIMLVLGEYHGLRLTSIKPLPPELSDGEAIQTFYTTFPSCNRPSSTIINLLMDDVQQRLPRSNHEIKSQQPTPGNLNYLYLGEEAGR